MAFDDIPENEKESFPCHLCNGSVEWNVTVKCWECDSCGWVIFEPEEASHEGEKP